MKKLSCIILALAVSVSSICFTSCKKEEKNSSSNHDNALVHDNPGKDDNASEKELPYGATIVKMLPENFPEINIVTEYDRRFLSEDEAALVSNYFNAINNNDTELFESLYYEGYSDFYGKLANAENTAGFLQMIKAEMTEIIKNEFVFDYLLINDCVRHTDDAAATYLFSELDAIIKNFADEKGDTSLMNSINSRKVVLVEAYYENDEEYSSLSNVHGEDMAIYIYRINGKAYIVS